MVDNSVCVKSKTGFITKISKAYALENLSNLYCEYNRVLSFSEFKNKSKNVSIDYYLRNGGLKYWWSLLGETYQGKQSVNNLTRESICELQRICKDIGRLPTVSEYDKLAMCGYKRRAWEKQEKISFRLICQKYAPHYISLEKRYLYGKEEIIYNIKKYFSSISYPPTYLEMRENGLPAYTTIRKYFNKTYSEVLADLCLEMRGSTTKSKTTADMIIDFKNFVDKNSRLPLIREFGGEIKSYDTYMNRFGSLKNLCELCDMDFLRYSKGIYDKNNNKCLSIIEQQISNFLINNGICFEKEFPYSKVIQNCKYVFDWAIKTTNGMLYVEYFGLYGENSKSDIIQKYTSKCHEKINTIKSARLFENCLFIYPKDLKERTLDDIFRLVLCDRGGQNGKQI